MKLCKATLLSFGLIAASVLPLATAYSQSAPAPAAPVAATPASLPSDLAPAANEVVKLVQSGVGDDVVLAFIRNSRTPFNLSANHIIYLKNTVSSPVLAAMVNHDGALRSAPAALAAPTAAYDQKLYAPGQAYPVAQPAVAAPAPALAAPEAPAPPPVPVVQPRSTSLIVEEAPPAPRLEIVGIAPGPEYVWAPGHWTWRGGAWIWVGGCWKLRPAPGAVWIGPRWAHHGRSYIYVKGYWR
jgi:hypothetical protein